MRSKYKLGDLITQRREKNNEIGLPISGVSKDGLIPPKQIDADTSIYNIFYRKDFIFNPARMELNSIAFNDKYDKAICSSLYEVFYVHRTDLIIPEYLALIVKQNWFTRYCEFLGQGSAREYCRFVNISEIEIDFPNIEIQKKIVYCYNVINKRITIKQRINDNLEATGLAIFKEKFSSPNDGFDEIPLYDLAEYINGTSFSEDEYSSDGLPIIKIAELKDGITSATQYFVGNKDPKYLIHDSDVLFSWSGNPDTSIDAFIWSHGDGILNQHTFRMVPHNGVAFTYFMLKFCKPEFVKAAMGKQTTGLGHVTVKDLKRLTLPFNEETAVSFNQAAMPLYEQIFKNLKEINALIELRNQTVQMLSIVYH